MHQVYARFVIVSALAFAPFLLSVGIAFADHCTAAKIAVVSGPWESTSAKTSYTVQAQDSAGALCHVRETLRLSFESSGSGTFTGQSGSPVQAWISTGSANRNFYYQNSTGADHTLTIKAGYGTADSWSVLFETSHDTAASAPPGDEASDSSTTDASDEDTKAQEKIEVSSASNTRKSGSNTIARARLFQDDPLQLVLSNPSRVSVGQPVLFAATPSGLAASELRTLRYLWSFGDSATSSERTPTHVYRYPGKYVVIGMALRAGHEIAVRTEVEVVPLAVTLSVSSGGDVLIENTASHEIEISGLTVSDGAHTFTISDYTHLLPKASIALPSAMTGFTQPQSAAFLHDREGTLLAQYPTVGSNGEGRTEGQPETEVKTQTLAPLPAPAQSQKTAIIPAVPLLPDVGSLDPDTAETVAKPVAVTGGESATSTELTEKTDDLVYSQQFAAVSAPLQRDAAPSPWKAPAAFIGVLLTSILALYVHKFV